MGSVDLHTILEDNQENCGEFLHSDRFGMHPLSSFLCYPLYKRDKSFLGTFGAVVVQRAHLSPSTFQQRLRDAIWLGQLESYLALHWQQKAPAALHALGINMLNRMKMVEAIEKPRKSNGNTNLTQITNFMEKVIG